MSDIRPSRPAHGKDRLYPAINTLVIFVIFGPILGCAFLSAAFGVAVTLASNEPILESLDGAFKVALFILVLGSWFSYTLGVMQAALTGIVAGICIVFRIRASYAKAFVLTTAALSGWIFAQPIELDDGLGLLLATHIFAAASCLALSRWLNPCDCAQPMSAAEGR